MSVRESQSAQYDPDFKKERSLENKRQKKTLKAMAEKLL